MNAVSGYLKQFPIRWQAWYLNRHPFQGLSNNVLKNEWSSTNYREYTKKMKACDKSCVDLYIYRHRYKSNHPPWTCRDIRRLQIDRPQF